MIDCYSPGGGRRSLRTGSSDFRTLGLCPVLDFVKNVEQACERRTLRIRDRGETNTGHPRSCTSRSTAPTITIFFESTEMGRTAEFSMHHAEVLPSQRSMESTLLCVRRAASLRLLRRMTSIKISVFDRDGDQIRHAAKIVDGGAAPHWRLAFHDRLAARVTSQQSTTTTSNHQTAQRAAAPSRPKPSRFDRATAAVQTEQEMTVK